MAEKFLRCRICNAAVEVSDDDIQTATDALASDHPGVPSPESYIVLYTRRDRVIAAIRNTGFADEDMEIPIFTRSPGSTARYN